MLEEDSKFSSNRQMGGSLLFTEQMLQSPNSADGN